MATHGLPDLDFVLYNGYDITGLITGLTDELANTLEDVTAAGGSVALSEYVGPQQANVELTAFYDSVISPQLESSPLGAVLMYAIEGNTAGKACECSSSALKTHYQRLIETKALHKAAVGFATQGTADVLDHALLIAPLAARGAAGNTQATYVDATAQTTSGGRWWATVTALTLGGYTNAKVQLMDSADHITYADIAAAVLTFTAIGAQMVAFSGTVRQYLAAAWSYTGAGSDPAITFAAALTKLQP